MKHFQFNIPSQYILSANDKGHYVGISYEVVDNKVSGIYMEISFDLTEIIVINDNFRSDVYAAAENNAISFDLLKADQEADLFKDMGQPYDIFKELGVFFNRSAK